MSMLAEKRRKQKWSLNPQGKHWLAESNKFGLKMLENMGWKEGKGLGKQQDGIKEPIRIAFKNDNKGLGLKESASSKQQDHFEVLLQSLNDDQSSKTTETITSLEKKSQSSRSRVHYKKFTRGKDLSRYSAKDLANIFEKKSAKTACEPIATNTSVSQKSMAEYFGDKMPNSFKLERRRSESDSEGEKCRGFGFEGGLTNPAFDPLLKPVIAVATHKLDTICEESAEILNETQKTVVEGEIPHKVKKCKRKRSHAETQLGIDNPGLRLDDVDERTEKKSKKRKNSNDNRDSKELDVVDKEKSKKRKKAKGIDNPALNLDCSVEEPFCDLMLNVVEEPVPPPKPKLKNRNAKRKGCDNYGFDIKAQNIEENINSISKNIEQYQAEVENGINEIKDEDLCVGDLNDDSTRNSKDSVFLQYQDARFTKDLHWTASRNQTATLAKKSYKHLIKGNISVGFKNTNLHEIKGYGFFK